MPFFVDWDEDGKRLSSSEWVFDLTDGNDLDELSLNNDDEVSFNDKDKVLLDNKDKLAPCNWT